MEGKLPGCCCLCSPPPQGADSDLGLSGNGEIFTAWPTAPSSSGLSPKAAAAKYRGEAYVGSRTGS